MNRICIFIPTYNRFDCIKYYIDNRGDSFFNYCIDVVVADSSNNDETEQYLKKYNSANLLKVNYMRFSSDTSLEKKVQKMFKKYGQTYEYIWLCGDSCILNINTIMPKINVLLDKKYDIIHLDNIDYFKIGDCEYTDCRRFFSDCFWRVTLYGATIISKRVVPYILNERTFSIYLGTGFAYQCSLMEFCAVNSFTAIHYVIDLKITAPCKKESVWESNVFLQFCKLWYQVIVDLPSVYAQEKKFVLKSHATAQNLFSIKKLLLMKIKGNLSFKLVKPYSQYIVNTTDTPICLIYVISLFPRIIIKAGYHLYKVLKVGK